MCKSHVVVAVDADFVDLVVVDEKVTTDSVSATDVLFMCVPLNADKLSLSVVDIAANRPVPIARGTEDRFVHAVGVRIFLTDERKRGMFWCQTLSQTPDRGVGHIQSVAPMLFFVEQDKVLGLVDTVALVPIFGPIVVAVEPAVLALRSVLVEPVKARVHLRQESGRDQKEHGRQNRNRHHGTHNPTSFTTNLVYDQCCSAVKTSDTQTTRRLSQPRDA